MKASVKIELLSIIAECSYEYETELKNSRGKSELVTLVNNKYEMKVLERIDEIFGDCFDIKDNFDFEIIKANEKKYSFPLNIFVALNMAYDLQMPSDEEIREFLSYYRIIKTMIERRTAATN